MDKNLSALKPALVWKHFAQIVRIPRPSSHEEKIRKYVMDFAKSRRLECKEDAAHNVYVRKPASKGMEDRKGVILQAHLDMVPQKNNDKKFDFTKDPIDAYIDGEWVTADGTTLGADNGIGAAAIPCRAGGRHAGARPPRSLVYRNRGDRYGRCLRVEKGPAPRRYPAEPRFGDRRRAVCGLRRRARCQRHLQICGGEDARAELYRCEDYGQGAQGRPLGHPDRMPACQCQQGAVPLPERRFGVARRVAVFGGRRWPA